MNRHSTIILAGVLAVFASLGYRLYQQPTINTPQDGTAALEIVIKQLPAFKTDGPKDSLQLADVEGKAGVLNIFASWCAPCKLEHPVLLDLQDAGVPLYGIAFQDQPARIEAYLQQAGNPFEKYGYDTSGTASVAFGVSGLPETFVFDANGKIIWFWRGPLTFKEGEIIKRLFTPL